MGPTKLVICMTFYGIILTYSRTVESKNIIRKTKYGKVRGFTTDLAQVFYGIPFADPAARWTAPVDPTPWSDTLDARQIKPNCYYGGPCYSELEQIGCGLEESEDCLFLNIYVPLGTTRKSRKAVMVWFHGGSFLTGSAAGWAHNAEMLAKKGGVIVVTTNYRIGALGFLVTGNTSNDITGNYGIMDQRQALKWVNKNIRFFGGDREQVTLFGNSAGADSVAIHLMSGKVDKYFQRAIMQSAPFTLPLKPENVAIDQGVKLGAIAGCWVAGSVNTTCLRELTADTIGLIQLQSELADFSDSALRSFMPWIAHIDGDEVNAGLIQGLSAENISPKPVVLGTLADEGETYVRLLFADPVIALAMPLVVRGLIPNLPPDALNLYPASNPLDARDELSDISTDYVFACPTRMIARELSKRMPVYSYVIDEPFPLISENYFGATFCNNKTCHGIEVPAVFQSAREEPFVYDNDELAFSDKLITYWSNFAKYGNPNRKLVNGTEWTRYRTKGKKSDTILELRKTEISNQRDFKSEVCDVWDMSGYQ